MKILSMIQPWASLLVLGETQYETRTWRTRYRGPLAIHASRKVDKKACRENLVRSLLARLGYSEDTLPTGVIMATCRLIGCYQVIDNNVAYAILENGQTVGGTDYQIGGYGVGHYVWELADMGLLPEFIPAKGQLGFWEHPLN